jgi:hypothetical protein
MGGPVVDHGNFRWNRGEDFLAWRRTLPRTFPSLVFEIPTLPRASTLVVPGAARRFDFWGFGQSP